MIGKTQFKLGLLTLAALVALVATAIGLGWRRFHAPTERYESYFDETVQGLDLGAPVKFRGVPIGTVSDIGIAADRRHVRVGFSITRGEARRLALARTHLELRAVLASQGVTGVRFIDVDFPSEAVPAPVLPFTTGDRYIPSRPSLLGGLSSDIEVTMRKLPALVDRSTSAMTRLEQVLENLDRERVPARVGQLLDAATGAAEDARRVLDELRRAGVPARVAAALDRAQAAIARLDRELDALSGLGELVASAKRATDSAGDVGHELGRSIRTSRAQLDRTLEEIGDAARSLRDFLDTLEREPDMLVKGRAKPRSR